MPRETVSFGELVSMQGFQRNSFREIWLNVKCQDRDKDYTEIHEEIEVLEPSRAEDRYTESQLAHLSPNSTYQHRLQRNVYRLIEVVHFAVYSMNSLL